VNYKELLERAFQIPKKPPRTETSPLEPPAADPDAGIPYCEWRARQLNELFRQHGQTGQPGRITAATVADGLGKALPAKMPERWERADRLCVACIRLNGF
jgi:hypothetical protein